MQYTLATDMYNEAVTHIGLPETDFLGFITKLDHGTFQAARKLPEEVYNETGKQYSTKNFTLFHAAACWIIKLEIAKKQKTNFTPLPTLL